MIQCGYYWDIVDALQFKKKFWIEELKKMDKETPKNIIKLFEEQRDRLDRIIKKLEQQVEDENKGIYYISEEEMNEILDNQEE